MQFSQILALFTLCALFGLAFAAPVDRSVNGINDIVRRQEPTQEQLQEDEVPVSSTNGTLTVYNPDDKPAAAAVPVV